MTSSATRRPLRVLAVPALGAALLFADLPAAGALPVAAASDPSASVVFDGRGFGHGRGMSQWGAYGAADAGLSWSQILDFYYPGAAQTARGDGDLRVWVSRDSDGVTQVPAQNGLTAVVGRTTYRLPSGPSYTAWRATASGSMVSLQYRTPAGRWTTYPTTAAGALVFRAGRSVQVTMPSGAIEEFSGSVIASAASGKVKTIVSTTMETYLRGVVPNEMPASWHSQALAAQSVAARTYAAAYRARKRAVGSPWDICDSIACQVYKPAVSTSWGRRTVLDDSRANAAIAATSGTVLTTPKGNYVLTEFSASNGGYTVDGGAFSQVAKPDPYDGRMKNTNSAWTKSVSSSTIEKTWGLGTLTGIEVVKRDGLGADGGRATTVRLVGTSRTVEVSGAKMRSALALRSDWFTPHLQNGTTRPGGVAATAPRPAVGSVATDWTGDRIADRLSVSGRRLVVQKGLGRGRYARPVAVAGAPSGLSRFVGIGDVDGDRKTDAVVIDRTNRLIVVRGDGRGKAAKSIRLGGGWSAFTSLSLADRTGDRRADIVATTKDGRRLLYAATSGGGLVFKGVTKLK